MAANIEALRAWAQAVVEQLPPESESVDRAQAALWLIDWNEQAAAAMDRLVARWNDRT